MHPTSTASSATYSATSGANSLWRGGRPRFPISLLVRTGDHGVSIEAVTREDRSLMVPPNTLFGGKQVHMRVDVHLGTRCSIHRGLHAVRGGQDVVGTTERSGIGNSSSLRSAWGMRSRAADWNPARSAAATAVPADQAWAP